MTPQLALKVLLQFDKAINKDLANRDYPTYCNILYISVRPDYTPAGTEGSPTV